MSITGERNGEVGFTLLELVVVLTIAGLILLAAPPLYSSLVPSYRLKAAAREFAGELRHARETAISSGKTVIVEASSDGYKRLDSGQINYWHSPILIASSGSASIGQGQQSPQVRFFSDGSSSGARFQIMSGARHAVVTVDWLTGKVTDDE